MPCVRRDGYPEPDMPQANISGIANVDKPAGMTSHDVVAAVRRASGQRRVGHAGTLDPMATGVLIVCLGEATRVVEYLMAGRKVYEAWVHLGVETDTYDAAGAVVATGAAEQITRAEIEETLSQFVGVIEQVPPMYSAIKSGGQPLYKLARRGIEVEREGRQVEIHEIRVRDWAPPLLHLDITCSKGTYIRSLAHDLGQALGCGGHLARLVRTASGRFTLAEATPLEALLESLHQSGGVPYLLPLDVALGDYPALILDAEAEARIRHGQQIELPSRPSTTGDLLRAYGPDGAFVALLRYDAASARWQPEKVFPPF